MFWSFLRFLAESAPVVNFGTEHCQVFLLLAMAHESARQVSEDFSYFAQNRHWFISRQNSEGDYFLAITLDSFPECFFPVCFLLT